MKSHLKLSLNIFTFLILLAALVASLSPLQPAYAAVGCLPGSYFNGSTCVSADPGHYAPGGGTQQFPCSPGYYQPNSGAAACIQSPVGYYVPGSAATSAIPCPSGSNSVAAAVFCTQTGPSFVVNDASDTDDSTCAVSPGDCTLREAINAANALSGADTITFASLLSGGTITLGSALPDITEAVTVDGSALASQISIDGNNTYRVFHVVAVNAEFDNLTIKNGYRPDYEYGAGIYADGGSGSSNTVTVKNSTFDSNHSNRGGAINANAMNLVVLNSTFVNNVANLWGGGVAVLNTGAVITNSTFFNNTATAGRGGAVQNYQGSVTLINNTIYGNSQGVDNVNGQIGFANTIIAGSTGSDCSADPTLVSWEIYHINLNQSNIIEDGTCTANSLNYQSGDPLLNGLANNGGPTRTMSLQVGSPANNTGHTATCTSTAAVWSVNGKDQRGITRNTPCDIGAVESATVTFDGNGADGGSMSNQVASSSTNLATNAYTLTGYTFANWNTQSGGGGTSYADNAPYPFTINTTLYAQWTAASQTLTFNSNGGTAVTAITQNFGTLVNAPADPTRAGYTFAGWFTDNTTFLDPYTFPHTMGLSTTIHAKWNVSSGGGVPIFADVPYSYWANYWIEILYNDGITGGCATDPHLLYCPNDPVTRAQMAIFILRSIHGSTYTPPPAMGTVFTDVPLGSFADAWIEQLAAEGITGGCTLDGTQYCPNDSITRAEMSIFLLRGKYTSAYTPPPATGTVFSDVTLGSFADGWIEQLFNEKIAAGCGGGNYCPGSPVTRAEMAVFLVETFKLP